MSATAATDSAWSGWVNSPARWEVTTASVAPMQQFASELYTLQQQQHRASQRHSGSQPQPQQPQPQPQQQQKQLGSSAMRGPVFADANGRLYTAVRVNDIALPPPLLGLRQPLHPTAYSLAVLPLPGAGQRPFHERDMMQGHNQTTSQYATSSPYPTVAQYATVAQYPTVSQYATEAQLPLYQSPAVGYAALHGIWQHAYQADAAVPTLPVAAAGPASGHHGE